MKTVPIPKAKCSKMVAATQVAPVRANSHSKDAKGNMPSLQGDQLLQAQKNLENSGNPPPRFMILDSFSDDHLSEVLGESGMVSLGEGRTSDLISLIRTKELV